MDNNNNYIKKNVTCINNINLLFPSCFLPGSGVNTVASTAFGITETICGARDARNTVFSLLEKYYFNRLPFNYHKVLARKKY